MGLFGPQSRAQRLVEVAAAYYEGTAAETRLRLSGAITQTIGAN